MLTLSHVSQLGEKLIELLLTLVKFTTADVVDAEERHNAIDDEKTVLVADEVLGNFVEEFHLMLGVDSPGVSDVLLGWVQSVSSPPRWRISYSVRDPRRSVLQSE